MSSKANKAKQQKLRAQEKAKRLNRVRGMVGNYSLTDNQAEFYIKALNSKESPKDFLLTTLENIKSLIANFDLITDTAADEELMSGMQQHYPSLHANILDNSKFLNQCLEAAQKVFDDNVETFETLGAGEMDIFTCNGAIEGYAEVQDNLFENAQTLMATISAFMNLYGKIYAESLTPEAETV